jgi:putative transcription factor
MSYKNSKYVDDCPICGGKIWKPAHIFIEGVRVTVCQSCSQLGVKVPKTTSMKIQSKIPERKIVKSKLSRKPKSYKISRQQDKVSNLEIVEDFASKIKNVREKNNLTQEKFALKLHEKASLIRSIESQKRIPTITLAKKIEKTYNIKLTKITEEDDKDYRRYIQKKKEPTTLGDMFTIKKKKKS